MRRKIILCIGIFILALIFACACSLLSTETKAELSADMIRCSLLSDTTSFVYTGEPIELGEDFITIIVDGEYVSNDYFIFEYKDNVNAGVATLVVTAKEDNPYAKGSAEVHFNIMTNTGVECNASDDLAPLLADPGVTGVQLWSDRTIPEGTTITVPQGKTLYMHYGYSFTNNGTLVNEGTIVIRGALLSTGARRASELINNGIFTNRGTLEIKDYAILEDNGTFTSESAVTNLGTVYLKDADKSFLTDGQGGAHYVRTPATAEDFSISECTYRQDCLECTPTVSATVNGIDFTPEYADNQRAGTGQVTVLIAERDHHRYGSVTIPFTIRKGQATAASFEELKTLISSENYDHYSIPSLVIPEGETFVFPRGEELTVSDSLRVCGEMDMLGDVSCGRFQVERVGSVSCDAMLTVRYGTFTIDGTFTNEEHGDWYFDPTKGSLSISGTFVNKGVAEQKEFGLMLGTVINEGTLELDMLTMIGTFVNSGNATITTVNAYPAIAYVKEDDSSFRNEQTGTLTILGDGYFEGVFANAGTFVNRGRLSFADGIEYSCTGTFDNTVGEVFLFEPLEGITDRVNLRHYLTDSDVTIEPEYLETYYNKADQRPAFTVNGEPLTSSGAVVRYRYTGAEKDADACVKVGEITVTVSIPRFEGFTIYAGEGSFTYHILPATVHVTSNNFRDALTDAGYDRLVLDEDIRFSAGYSRIVTYCDLDLNGHCLTLGRSASDLGSIHFYGTLTGGAAVDPNAFIPSEEAACMVIESGSGFFNYGRVVNNGFIYSKGTYGFYGNYTDTERGVTGVVFNHGVIYTSQEMTVDASSTGIVFKRVDLTDIKRSIGVPEVTYTGTELMPAPTVRYQDAVDISRFTLTYSANVEVGMGRLQFAVKDAFDRDFYGAATVEFHIRLGRAEVATEEAFIVAAENVNFERVTLLADITLHSAVTAATNEGKVIDLDVYEIFFVEGGSLTLQNRVTLELKAGTEERFVKYFYGASDITLTADIGEADTPIELNFKNYMIPNVTGGSYQLTRVDMNGHSFPGGLIIGNDNIEYGYYYFENNSENVSAIGNALGGFALDYRSCREETDLFFTNLTIYGVKMGGGDGSAQRVAITAQDCTFLAARDTHKACVFKVISTMTAVGDFIRCTFDGANAFRANQGAFAFYDCTLHSYDVYSDTYSNHYGDAIFLEYSGRHGMSVEVARSAIISEYGNGIHLLNRNAAVSLTVDDVTTFTRPDERLNVVG